MSQIIGLIIQTYYKYKRPTMYHFIFQEVTGVYNLNSSWLNSNFYLVRVHLQSPSSMFLTPKPKLISTW